MSVQLIQQVRIVLIGTTHPGNIGAAARAMKSMGITDLVLVSPQAFPHPEAVARATAAADILEQARVVQTLPQAIEDCGLAIATSCQIGSLRWPELPISELGTKVLSEASSAKPVAIVFGRERTGMHLDEVHQCQYLVQIPSYSECRSLNLAAAVQVLCYEVMMASLGSGDSTVGVAPCATLKRGSGEQSATQDELQRFYDHLFRTLEDVEFLNREQPKRLRERLTRLFTKARLDQNEVNILRGILTAVNQKRSRS